jgi:uncharacterized protein
VPAAHHRPDLLRSNLLAWSLPFAVFMAVLAVRGAMGEPSTIGEPSASSWHDPRYWYAVQAGAAAVLLALFWRRYGELHARQLLPSLAQAGLAVAVGAAVFGAWIHLDAPWMTLGASSASFTPTNAQGELQWGLVAARVAGAVLVVPLMEELFWRSFLARWIDDAQFERVDPQALSMKAMVLSTFAFVLAHTLWLAAALAGLAYALLYRATGKLWVSVIAHAVTNALLAWWVLRTQQWQFW